MFHRFLPAVLLVTAFLLPTSATAANPPFPEWLDGIREQALQQGISPATLAVLDGLEPDERVIGFDRRQPEFTQTFEEYLSARVSETRIRMAREFFAQERETLSRIGAHYGVDPEYLVAFWGLESSFGRYMGKYSVIRSLATLGHDERRSAFFTSELFAALKILDEGHVTPEAFLGGWAGAMGQNQFLPSSFRRYAQDFDGDGRKNIWSSQEDVWASIAYYLKQNGWQEGAGWGTEVTVPADLDPASLAPASRPSGCRALRSHTRKLPVSEWQKLGVTGELASLPEGEWALVYPDSDSDRSYLAGGNFRSILAYNCANKYAVSVGLLADLIRTSD